MPTSPGRTMQGGRAASTARSHSTLRSPASTRAMPPSTDLSSEARRTRRPCRGPLLAASNVCFFHHATYTIIHPQQQSVLCAGGRRCLRQRYAHLAPREPARPAPADHSEPAAVNRRRRRGREPHLSGAPQPNSHAVGARRSPSGAPTGVLGSPQRPPGTSDLDSANAPGRRATATKRERAFIDRYALSQLQVTDISQEPAERPLQDPDEHRRRPDCRGHRHDPAGT